MFGVNAIEVTLTGVIGVAGPNDGCTLGIFSERSVIGVIGDIKLC